MERSGEIHGCAPTDNNGGFQRPQSLISAPCYQRFYPLETGRSTAPVARSQSQHPGHYGLREVAGVSLRLLLEMAGQGVPELIGPISDKEAL